GDAGVWRESQSALLAGDGHDRGFVAGADNLGAGFLPGVRQCDERVATNRVVGDAKGFCHAPRPEQAGMAGDRPGGRNVDALRRLATGGSGMGGNLVAVEAGGVSFAGQSSKAIFSFNRVGAAAVAGLQLWSVWKSAGVRHRALLSAGDRS